jgi:hypothetical protein
MSGIVGSLRDFNGLKNYVVEIGVRKFARDAVIGGGIGYLGARLVSAASPVSWVICGTVANLIYTFARPIFEETLKSKKSKFTFKPFTITMFCSTNHVLWVYIIARIAGASIGFLPMMGLGISLGVINHAVHVVANYRFSGKGRTA